jgi:predicted dehydrogenase
MTTETRQAEELLRISQDRGLTLLVDHIFLYTSAIKHLESLIRSGQMGQLHYAESTRINLAPPHATHNVVWDLAPHDVSICLYLFNEMPDKVICHAKRYRHPSLEDVASIHLFFPSEKWAHIHVSWLGSRKTREMRVFCAEKSAFYDDTAEDKIRIFGKGMDTRLAHGAAAPLLHSYGPDSTETPVLDRTEPLRNEASDFLECLTTGKQQSSSGCIGHSVICILEAAAESMNQMGKMVEVRTGIIP